MPIAAAQQIDVSLDSVEHPAFTARGIRVAFDLFHPGAADIAVAELKAGASSFRDLRLRCRRFHLDERRLSCDQGSLQRGQRPPLAISLAYRFADGRLKVRLRDVEAAAWATLIKRLRRWHPTGRFDVEVDADRNRAKLDFAARSLGFHNADYSTAAENIAASLTTTAQREGKTWRWQATANWSAGEAFHSPWYRQAGVRFDASGTMTPALLQVDLARVTLDRLGTLTAGLTWDRKAGAVKRWGFVTDPLDLSSAVSEWVKPVLEARALPTVTATGTTRYAAEWSAGELQSFYAGIENASFAESSGRLSLHGVNASVPWSRHEPSAAQFSVAGGQLDDFALGGFHLPVRLHGFDVAVPAATIPFLDGRIRIDEFRAIRPGTAWRGRFAGSIENVSMPRLTSAMGLPPMAGSLSMHIPAAEYADRVLHLGGDMRIDVFNGAIRVRNLKLIDPLSPTSRFVADVEARRLDLGLLTSTFSFGSIVGPLDIDIGGLELHNWQPLAFRARIASSPGDYRRAISRGALIDISALGGAAGAAAVRAIPAAGFLNTLRYDRIGLTCILKDGVCRMDGLRPEKDGYVIIEGRGIPALKVMGYNRDVDWKLLVSRFKAVIAGKSKAIIE